MMLNRGGAGFSLQSDAGDALEAVAGDAVQSVHISPCDDAFTDDDTCKQSVDFVTAFF